MPVHAHRRVAGWPLHPTRVWERQVRRTRPRSLGRQASPGEELSAHTSTRLPSFSLPGAASLAFFQVPPHPRRAHHQCGHRAGAAGGTATGKTNGEEKERAPAFLRVQRLASKNLEEPALPGILSPSLLASSPLSSPLSLSHRLSPSLIDQRLLDLGDVLGVDDFFSGWFHGAPASDIKRGNVLEFIAYGFYCARLESLAPAERADVDQYVLRVEAKRGKPFPAGTNPAATFMAHLWEPLRTLHKPLALHAAGEAMRAATDGALWCLGFDRAVSGAGVRYWVRAPGRPPLRPAPLAWAVGQAVGVAWRLAPFVPARLRVAVSEFVGVSGRAGEASVAPVPCPEEVDEEEEVAGVSSARPPAAAGALRARGGHPLLPPIHPLFRAPGSAAALGGGGGPALPASSPPPPPARVVAPLLFVHGVGLGLTPYLHFIAELASAAPARPLLLVEARHVSVGLAARAISTCDVAASVCAILDAHAWPAAACVGHSYGTFVLSRLAQLQPGRVQALALIDPVCLLTIYPQLLRNFVYKPAAVLARWRSRGDPARFGAPLGAIWKRWRPGKGGRPTSEDGAARRSTLSSGLSAALATIDSARFLFSRDLVVAEAFCRRFVWHRECLWPHELCPASTLLVLAGQDDLVPSSLVIRLLDRAPPAARPRVDMNVDAGHGGFLTDGAWRARVVAGIVAVAEAGAAKAAAAAAAVTPVVAPASQTLSASSPPKTLSLAGVKRGVVGGGGGGLIQASAAGAVETE